MGDDMNIDKLLEICNGTLIGKKIDIDINNVDFSKDTRTINNGDIYVGIKGESFNGNNFYKEAFDKGASICILDKDTIVETDIDKAVILVDNTVKAIQELAKYKRSLYNIPVIAITGSVGKTSVKDMVYCVVNSKYKTLATIGNYNNEIGLPLTVLSLREHEAMVLEMGMNSFNEIHVLSEIAKPTISLITNIGTAHIGNLGSRENILKAKLEILDGMNGGKLIINNDNDMLRTVKYDNLITIGIDNKSMYNAHDINDNVFSADFYINDSKVSIPVGSKAFVYNSLFAYAVGKELGISDSEIIQALSKFKLSPHRLEMIKIDKYMIIDDTYNASLDSVRNSLTLLSKVNNRKVFIFADILETDEFGKEIHENVGRACIENNIDVVITVGELSKYTYDILKDSKIESYHFSNNQNLISEIDNILETGDAILIKGSHSMNLIEIVNYLK